MTDRLIVVDLAATSKNWALTPDGERRLREETPPGWTMYVVPPPTSSDGDGPPRPSDEVMGAIREAEVYFGFGIPKLLFAEAKRLRWVHSAAAGVGTALYPEMVASDVLFTNSAGIHAVPIAEYVVAAVLHFLRGLDIAIDQQRRTEWNKTPFVRVESVLREMDTVRALIVGVGGLGGAAAERLSALGARCTGVRRRVALGPPPGFERVVSPRRPRRRATETRRRGPCRAAHEPNGQPADRRAPGPVAQERNRRQRRAGCDARRSRARRTSYGRSTARRRARRLPGGAAPGEQPALADSRRSS